MYSKFIFGIVLIYFLNPMSGEGPSVKYFNEIEPLVVKKVDNQFLSDDGLGDDPFGDVGACEDIWKVRYTQEKVYIGKSIPITFETTDCTQGGNFRCPHQTCTEEENIASLKRVFGNTCS